MHAGTVRELLEIKGNSIWSIDPDTSVLDALRLLAEKDIGALPVVTEGKLVGIFSERDYARKVILKGKSSETAKVNELMSKRVISVGPDETIDMCMKLMTAKKVRHIPVLKKNDLVGILSIGDVVRTVISDQEYTIHELEKYIQGEGYGA